MMLDERRLAPIGDLPPLHQRHHAAAVDIGGDGSAADFRECRVEVDILDDFVDRVPGRDARTDDDERDFNIRIVSGHFSRHQPELAHVIPVRTIPDASLPPIWNSSASPALRRAATTSTGRPSAAQTLL